MNFLSLKLHELFNQYLISMYLLYKKGLIDSRIELASINPDYALMIRISGKLTVCWIAYCFYWLRGDILPNLGQLFLDRGSRLALAERNLTSKSQFPFCVVTFDAKLEFRWDLQVQHCKLKISGLHPQCWKHTWILAKHMYAVTEIEKLNNFWHLIINF